MSSFNIKSRYITTRDTASIHGLVQPNEGAAGVLREAFGADKATSDIIDAGSQFRLVSVPSSARIAELDYTKETTGTTVLDVAVWYPTTIPQGGTNAPAASNAAALISSSAFATNLSGSDLGIDWTTAMGLATAPNLQKRQQPLWQLLGLSTDPGIDLDMGFTVRTATAEQGYVGMRVRYVL
jgi:hypothetical protein